GMKLATVAITKVKRSMATSAAGSKAKRMGISTAAIRLTKASDAGIPTTTASDQASAERANASVQNTAATRRPVAPSERRIPISRRRSSTEVDRKSTRLNSSHV